MIVRMKNIKQETNFSDDTENNAAATCSEYLDYKDMVIEVDEKILKFISSFVMIVKA